MPRNARKQSQTSIYHVVSRGIARQIVFETDDDRAFFMTTLSDSLQAFDGKLLAWCLMDNHFHLLIRADRENLSSLMKRTLSAYAGYFNRVHGRNGTLFEGRFKSEPVETEEYLLTVVRYIHYNPVKAHMSDSLSFPWSSYDEFLSGSRWTFVGYAMEAFGSRAEFKRFHAMEPDNGKILDLTEAPTRALSDGEAMRIATSVLGGVHPAEVKSHPREARDEELRMLRRQGLSVRQIQRLTGISLGTIAKAK